MGKGHPGGNPGDVPGRETVLPGMAEGEHQGAQEAHRGAGGFPGTAGADHGRRHRCKGLFRGGVLGDAPGTPPGNHRGRRVEAPVRVRHHRVGQAVPGRFTREAAGFPVHAVLQGTGGRRVERSQGVAGRNRAQEAGKLAFPGASFDWQHGIERNLPEDRPRGDAAEVRPGMAGIVNYTRTKGRELATVDLSTFGNSFIL